MNKLALVIPGLLGPLPELDQQDIQLPDCSVLQKWLACAETTTTRSENYYDLLAELFGIRPDYAITKISALMDNCGCSQGHWLRADPVHFKADMEHTILFDQNSLHIDDDEARALVDSFNQHFAEDGIKLYAGHRHRWYLSFDCQLDIQTTPLPDAVGRNVNHFLPVGADALNWKRLLNETQMLFHAHEVNTAREARGLMTINSLWLWGEGEEPQSVNNTDWYWLMANDAVAQGVALCSEIKSIPLADAVEELHLPDGNGMIVLDQVMGPASYGDVYAWKEAVEKICLDWFGKLHQLLTTKQIKQLELYSADGRRFNLTSASLLKFWRRKKPVSYYLSRYE